MNGQPTVSSLAERLAGSKREKLRDHHKEHRLSKADIGGPISATTDKKVEIVDAPESLGAPSMVMRCLIVQRDDKGYGLTVSGDNPVYVQSVKENGAAFMAGVRQGDRIIKVNGTNVSEYNHIEVVKLIKSGNYVALSVLGPPLQGDVAGPNNSTSNQTVAANANFIKRPQLLKDNSFYDEKVNTIKKMLEQERVEVEAESLKQTNAQDIPIQQDRSVRDPIADTEDMDSGIVQEENDRVGPTQSEEVEESKRPNISKNEKGGDDPTHEGNAILIPGNNQTRPNDSNVSNEMDDGGGGSEGMQQHNPNIMNFEEDELAEDNGIQDHGPFMDFDKLRLRPAHTAVFINYVFRSHDPCSLLLVLSVENLRSLSSMKEMLKASDHICKTFLTPNATLKVDLDEGISKSIIETVHSRNISEETLRVVFDPAVQHAIKAVRMQLHLYCNKREQGLSYCFGEEKIMPGMEHSQEVKVVEEILTPLIQDLSQPQANGEDGEVQKMNAKMEALEKFVIQWTGKRKSKLTSRIGSMLRPNRPNVPMMRPKTASSMESIIDEQNKRTSILGKWGGKKAKQKETSSTVIPVVQSSHSTETFVDPGIVSHLINKFQDTPGLEAGSVQNAPDGSDGLTVPANKKDKGVGRAGSFRGERRQRSATGKSNSDPDVNTVELALSSEAPMDHSQLSTSTSVNSMASTGSGSVSGSLTSTLSSSILDDQIYPLNNMDPELDVEPESQWSLVTPKEVIKQLDKKECKRQEIINELLHTEKHHVRDLLILELLFHDRMKSEGMLNSDELYLVFPNLHEILQMHRQLKKALQEAKEKDGHVMKDIADILLETFDGSKGNTFKEECAKYCGNQTAALEFIKERCKKDQKFNSFIQTTERHSICRRLQLKDFVPVEFQRLTKYPLLLENIIKNTKKKEEVGKLRTVHKQCKEILSYVNKAVKAAEDHQKIIEIQKNLDASSLHKVNHPIVLEYRNINLVERTLVHQGSLTWRITQTEKKKSVVLHCVLFEDIMVLLQKQDDRYVLKCHTSTAMNSSKDEKSTVQPPILKLSKVIVRNVATDKRAFFVVSMSEFGPQIYELVATTTHESHEWLKVITATAEAAKKKDASSGHIRRDGFMIAGSSKSNRGDAKEPSSEQQRESSIRNDELDSGSSPSLVDDDTILVKIQKKHEEISAALVFKHNLLAAYTGIEASHLDDILDMSQMDDEAEPKAVVLQSLMSVKKLTSVLNDILIPDTVFLKPPPAPILLPTPEKTSDLLSNTEEETETATPTPDTTTALTSANNQTDEAFETPDERWATPAMQTPPNKEENQEQLPTPGLPALYDNPTPDRRSNASMDLLLSDYETASEPTSPSRSVTEDTSRVEELESSTENENIPLQEADIRDEEKSEMHSTVLDQDSTSHTDAGIGLSENQNDAESDNTLSAVETDSVRKLISPIGYDLLDFGPAISPPDITVSSSPVGASTSDGLMARADPVSVTKMIEVTQSLETQLLWLLRALKDSDEEKQRLAVENSRLLSMINPVGSSKSEADMATDPLPQEDISVLDHDTSDGVPPSYAEIVSDFIMMPTSPLSPTTPNTINSSPMCGLDHLPLGQGQHFTFKTATGMKQQTTGL